MYILFQLNLNSPNDSAVKKMFSTELINNTDKIFLFCFFTFEAKP